MHSTWTPPHVFVGWITIISEPIEVDFKSIHFKISGEARIFKPKIIAKIKYLPFELQLHRGWDSQQKNVWHEAVTLGHLSKVETKAQCLYVQISRAWKGAEGGNHKTHHS